MFKTEIINPCVQHGVCLDDPGIHVLLPSQPPLDVDGDTLVEEVVLLISLYHLGSLLPELHDGVHHINGATASLDLLSEGEEGQVGSCKDVM